MFTTLEIHIARSSRLRGAGAAVGAAWVAPGVVSAAAGVSEPPVTVSVLAATPAVARVRNCRRPTPAGAGAGDVGEPSSVIADPPGRRVCGR
ncbi:Uncharacterised protein [Mycobacteroides abscessus]|nr:Uncharacterised protein [Mycobacteroides abscessus]